MLLSSQKFLICRIWVFKVALIHSKKIIETFNVSAMCMTVTEGKQRRLCGLWEGRGGEIIHNF